MDYRELLKKYARHVIEYEGVSFLEPHRLSFGVDFTPEELTELRQIETELDLQPAGPNMTL